MTKVKMVTIMQLINSLTKIGIFQDDVNKPI